jgi:hypothetical protein
VIKKKTMIELLVIDVCDSRSTGIYVDIDGLKLGGDLTDGYKESGQGMDSERAHAGSIKT